MLNPAKGTKRLCPSCGARFYDLSRAPIICPGCQAVYQVTPPPTRRGERAAPPEPKQKPEPVIKAPVVEEPDTISLEDAEAAEVITGDDDEEIGDLGGDEPEIPASDDENAFLEETADEEPDVSGIVGGSKGEEG